MPIDFQPETQSTGIDFQPDEEIPRFRIEPPDNTPTVSTEPIPRGLSKAELQQRQVNARVEGAIPRAAETALNYAEPVVEGLTPSAILNTPNRLVKVVAPNSVAAKDAFSPNTPVINVPSPTGTGVAAGLGKLGAGILNSLTTPESIITLPAAAQSAVVRAIFGGEMAYNLPEQAKNAVDTLSNPDATTADKIVAVGNPVVQSAMIAALSTVHGAKPKSGLSAEDVTTNEKPLGEGFQSPSEPSNAHSIKPAPEEVTAPSPPANIPNENLPKNEVNPPSVVETPAAPETEIATATVSDAPAEPTTPVIPPPPEGERIVTIQREDGTTYPAAFSDKFYDHPKRGQVASIARLNEQGKWSHGMLSPDEKILPEVPTATTPEPVENQVAIPQPNEPSQPVPVAPAGNPTAMKFATLDKEREARGLPPLLRRERVSDQETINKALDVLNKNDKHAENLVKELNLKPRAISDVDRATLLLHKIDLTKQYDSAAEDLIKARDSGDTAAAESANVRVADASDRLQRLEEASGRSGSEQGAGLRALQIMANEDYSLAGLERRARASKGGEPLTDAERSELIKTAADYKKANDELQKHIEEKSERISELEVKSALDKIALEAKSTSEPKPQLRSHGLLSKLEVRANAARERIKNRPAQLNSGLDPTQLLASLRDEIEIGAYHIARIGSDIAKWSKKQLDDWTAAMKKEIGDNPNFPIILQEAKKTIDEVSKPLAVEEQISNQKAKIKSKFENGKKDEISSQVQKLARLLVESGIKDRNELIDAVHAVLKELEPEITRREAMDAISGYGDFKPLSRDEISVTIRGLKGEMQQVSKLEDMANGIPPSKTGIERRTPTDAERKLIKAVNEAKIKFQVPITDPVRQIKSALDTKKIQLQNSIKDMEDKIANGDFARVKRRPLELDRRAQELQAERGRVQKRFKAAQLKFEREAMSKTPRAADFISSLRRFAVLSGVHVLGKLAAYTATKVPTIALTEAIGGAINKIPKISQIAAKAPSEGHASLPALSKAVAKGFTQGFVDAYKTATTGQSDLKAAYSKRPETERNWLNFFQTLHEVIKSPLRRTAFELSLAKRIEFAASKDPKFDVNDPITQLQLAQDAFLDSDRALLLENNRVANAIRVALKNIEAPNKNTGAVPFGGKTISTIGRIEMPILSVPLNYFRQTIDTAFGLAIGSGKAAMAFRRGIDKLDPHEADEIIRHLKYGSVGGAALLYGFYDGYKNANQPDKATFGGFYQAGEKRKDNQAGINGIKIGGVNLPGLVLHNPVIAAAQLGATFGKMMNTKINKSSSETHSMPVAAAAAVAGLISQSPIGSEANLLSQITDVRSAEYALGEHVKGLIVPQLVNEAAQFTDTDKNGKPIKRNPKSAMEHIKTGIPVLRETVKKK